MNLLAIETATNVCGLAYFHNGELAGLEERELNREHAERLPFNYRELKKTNRFQLSNLGGIAISIGPGSFTGLRIGLSYAKGLAFSVNIPLIPVPTLQTLVWGSGINNGKVLSVLHSHKDLVYHQRFDVSEKKICKLSEARSEKWDDFIKDIEEGEILCQYGCDTFLETMNIGNVVKTVSPSSRFVGELALSRFETWKIEKFYQLEPNYISHFKIQKHVGVR